MGCQYEYEGSCNLIGKKCLYYPADLKKCENYKEETYMENTEGGMPC